MYILVKSSNGFFKKGVQFIFFPAFVTFTRQKKITKAPTCPLKLKRIFQYIFPPGRRRRRMFFSPQPPFAGRFPDKWRREKKGRRGDIVDGDSRLEKAGGPFSFSATKVLSSVLLFSKVQKANALLYNRACFQLYTKGILSANVYVNV